MIKHLLIRFHVYKICRLSYSTNIWSSSGLARYHIVLESLSSQLHYWPYNYYHSKNSKQIQSIYVLYFDPGWTLLMCDFKFPFNSTMWISTLKLYYWKHAISWRLKRQHIGCFAFKKRSVMLTAGPSTYAHFFPFFGNITFSLPNPF